MADQISLESLRQMIEFFKTQAAPAPVVTIHTQEQADEQTAQSKALGWDIEWRVGDTYYVLPAPAKQ